MKRFLAVFLVIALVMCALCGCGGTTSTTTAASDETTTSSGENAAEAAAGNTADGPVEITVGVPQDLDSLDPYLMTAAGTREVMFNVYEGLVKANSNGEYICAVASDYTVSEDGLVYTFYLRDGVVFHNGQTVTPEDVIYSIKTCAETTVTPAVASALSAAESIEADGNSVIITLPAMNNEFVAYLSMAYIVPANSADLATNPVGTGPFKFVSRSVQENVILEKNDDYYGTPAFVDRVVIRVFEDQTAMLTALDACALDLAIHIQDNEIQTLSNGYNVLQSTMNLVVALYLNNRVAPLNDQRVREALNYAIDVDEIIELASNGYGVKEGTSMYPAFGKYYDENMAASYAVDRDKAVALLKEAGYPNGFELTIRVPSNYAHPYGDMAEVIIEQLAQVGVSAAIQWDDWSTWVAEVNSDKQFEATIIGLQAKVLTASSLLQRWTSSDKSNLIGYNNPEFDTLFAEAVSCTDDAQQTELYMQCLQMLIDTAANVYLQDLGEFVVINPALEGYEFYPLYVMDLSTIKYIEQ